jgi:hypothetical protein
VSIQNGRIAKVCEVRVEECAQVRQWESCKFGDAWMCSGAAFRLARLAHFACVLANPCTQQRLIARFANIYDISRLRTALIISQCDLGHIYTLIRLLPSLEAWRLHLHMENRL